MVITNVLYRVLGGLGCSAIFTFIALTALVIGDTEAAVRDIWQHMAGSMILGVTYGVSSYIFDYERWSLLRQLAVHYLLTLTVFALVNLWVGWVPLTPLSLLLGFVIYSVNYTLFWFGFNWYFKMQERELNQSLNKK